MTTRYIRFLLLILCVYLVSAAWGQQSTPLRKASPAIHGQGTPNTVPKFKDAHTLQDSGITESGGMVAINERVTVSGTIDGSTGAPLMDVSNGAPVAAMALHAHTVGAERAEDGTVALRGSVENDAGFGIGVLGETLSPDAVPVLGNNAAPSGGGTGVLGTSNSPAGVGVAGNNNSTTGDPMGVVGSTASTDRGIGVRGQANATTGAGIGVLGEAVSPNGEAGVFNALGGGTILMGISTLAGEPAARFRVDATGKVFANGGFQFGGADFAESMAVSGDRSRYEPGDLLVIDRSGQRRLALSESAYSTLVGGIYSTKPGMLASPYTMDDPNLAKEVPMAVVGIVPCKVSAENGAIEVGDLLVTSSTPGHAMKGTDRNKMLGAVVGKALEPLREGRGVVQVLITLQ